MVVVFTVNEISTDQLENTVGVGVNPPALPLSKTEPEFVNVEGA